MSNSTVPRGDAINLMMAIKKEQGNELRKLLMLRTKIVHNLVRQAGMDPANVTLKLNGNKNYRSLQNFVPNKPQSIYVRYNGVNVARIPKELDRIILNK